MQITSQKKHRERVICDESNKIHLLLLLLLLVSLLLKHNHETLLLLNDELDVIVSLTDAKHLSRSIII